MGYAKLNFATSVTTSQALFDIVRVVNGTITSAANLSHASTTNSEIVNTLGQNWTVTYGTVANTTLAYVLENSCETAGKTKYAWLTTNNDGSYGGASAAFSTTNQGIYLNTITAATSATSVSNPAYYNTETTTNYHTRFNMCVDATNTLIYVSWSKYHLMLYGRFRGGGSGTMGLTGTFEYPETNLSQFTNTAPIIHYRYSSADTNTFQELVGAQTGATPDSIIFQATNLHYPQTNVTQGISWNNSSTIGTADLDDFNPVQTINASGTSVFPLVPIYESMPALGIPIINISKLSGVYKMATTAGPYDTIYTVGADNYVWLPLALNINSTTGIVAGIAIPKK
jgi:hypothetical protein